MTLLALVPPAAQWRSRFAMAVIALFCATPALAAPDVVLKGSIGGADNGSYRDLPFAVPDGVSRITVTFHHPGAEQKTVIDLGLWDNERFRGWSGGDKTSFTISETDATPSYLIGPIRAGTWHLILGVPNIRKDAHADYEADITFSRAPVADFTDAPLAKGPAWYRGDLHMHTAQSDGTCDSQSGKRVPCPLYKTIEAAAARGLDFIAVSDHNTISHFNDERELQPYFDKLLLIPAREITTYQGHANVFGTEDFIDFRLGTPSVPSFDKILDQVEAAHGIISINHPKLPSGEVCMGCGWSVPNTDYKRVQAIEIVNGGTTVLFGNADNPLSGIPFWEDLLNRGYRLTGIGGSDNHNGPSAKAPVGAPATVVYADNLSGAAILTAIRAGHVFVDADGSKDGLLTMTASLRGKHAMMGGALVAREPDSLKLSITAHAATGATLKLIEDGKPLPRYDTALTNGNLAHDFHIAVDGKRHWLRAEVRDVKNHLLLIGNPIYLNF